MNKLNEVKKPSEEDIQDTLDTILSDTRSYATSLNYAMGYVRYAKGMTGRELEVQCIYILNNISHWRHKEAKNVRNILKQFAGIKLIY